MWITGGWLRGYFPGECSLCGGLRLRGSLRVRGSLRFGVQLGLFLGTLRIDGGSFGGVNRIVVFVGFGEPLLVEQKTAETVL